MTDLPEGYEPMTARRKLFLASISDKEREAALQEVLAEETAALRKRLLAFTAARPGDELPEDCGCCHTHQRWLRIAEVARAGMQRAQDKRRWDWVHERRAHRKTAKKLRKEKGKLRDKQRQNQKLCQYLDNVRHDLRRAREQLAIYKSGRPEDGLPLTMEQLRDRIYVETSKVAADAALQIGRQLETIAALRCEVARLHLVLQDLGVADFK